MVSFSVIPTPLWILTFDQVITSIGVPAPTRFTFNGPDGEGPPATMSLISGTIRLAGGKATAPQTSLAYAGPPPDLVGDPAAIIKAFTTILPFP
jgi:hypothetical protein